MNPTQAQIEAARILCEVRRDEPCQRVEWNLDDKDCKICDFALLNSKQAAALTAAAKVREEVKFCAGCNCKTWHVNGVCEFSDGHIIATIERCAHVAENLEFIESVGESRKATAQEIAAAIRELKE